MSIAELRQLPVDEKLRIIETLWSDLSGQDEDIAAPAWHEQELSQTQTAFLEGREEVMDWSDAKKELRSRFE
jgi:Putative addiction module component